VWIGYVAVESVDATVEGLLKAGAQACVPPTTYPGVGRFSMLRDPQGAPFYVMKPESQAGGVSHSFAAEVGHCQWNELLTSDPAAALAFYTRQLGWEKGDVMPMGPMGDYQFLINDGVRFGALMKRAEPQAPSLWRFYFGVEDIDRAARAIVAGGGNLKGEPQPVPGGGFAVAAFDPQGAEFGVAGPRR
jgi:predicted enzyme related to lactoylglutathione lyase